MNTRLLLATLLAMAATGRVTAQPASPTASVAPVADDSLAAAVGTSYLDNSIRGFGRAEILGPDGSKKAGHV